MGFALYQYCSSAAAPVLTDLNQAYWTARFRSAQTMLHRGGDITWTAVVLRWEGCISFSQARHCS